MFINCAATLFNWKQIPECDLRLMTSQVFSTLLTTLYHKLLVLPLCMADLDNYCLHLYYITSVAGLRSSWPWGPVGLHPTSNPSFHPLEGLLKWELFATRLTASICALLSRSHQWLQDVHVCMRIEGSKLSHTGLSGWSWAVYCAVALPDGKKMNLKKAHTFLFVFCWLTYVSTLDGNKVTLERTPAWSHSVFSSVVFFTAFSQNESSVMANDLTKSRPQVIRQTHQWQ